jgi:cardiolipin synthase
MNENLPLQQIIFSDSHNYFQSLLSDINTAHTTIDLETYIFAHDVLGEKIAEALTSAAKRGVKVRVLVDGAGSPQWGNLLTQKLEEAGAQTRIFHPFPWALWQWSHSHVRVPILLKAIYLFMKMNSRTHRKYCLVDNKIAYIGSFNISKVHLSHAEGGDNWRDTGVKISGINLQEIKSAFEIAWYHMPIQERIQNIFRQKESDPIIRLNNTRHRRRSLYKNLLYRINHCKNRIWMTNAYFIPDNFLLKHLREAAKRGIDVRIVLPKKSDVFFMSFAASMFYQSLLKSGVRIFEYLPSMLHTKALILDDWMIVGSSNFNHRSFLHDLEVDVNIFTSEAKQAIERQFTEDLKTTQEVQLEHWQKRPFYLRIIGRWILYWKYLI